ncbi:MAG TPA: DEAD/DEAH box helicase [Candidatus Tumulicola sp.]
MPSPAVDVTPRLEKRRRTIVPPPSVLHAGIAGRSLLLWSESLRAPALRGLLLDRVPALDPAAYPKVAVKFASGKRAAGEALALDANAAILFLRAVAGRELFGAGVVVGDDVGFWCDALRLAAEIVVAQRFLPGVVSDAATKTHRAVWEPVLGPRERGVAAALLSAMPDAATALETFLAITVDALVRRAAIPPAAGRNGEQRLLHDRWASALRSADSTLAATPAEVRGLAVQIASWRQGVLEEHGAEYRLCLRVEEPQTDDGPWYVAYLLQSRVDPTLQLDARDAMTRAAQRRAFLASLGRAAQVSPDIDASLRAHAAAPLGFTLDTPGAYRFLSETAWLLEHAGVGVILPAWWLGKNARTRLTTRARIKTPAIRAGLRVDSLLEVDWSVVIGDASLSARELERLAKLKVPLVRVRGQWVHVEARELRAAIERLKAGPARLSLAEVARLQLDPQTPVDARGGVAALLDRLQGNSAYQELAPPDGLRATLRPYQLRGYSWLRFLTSVGFGACLADDMGLGKTIQTLGLILRDWRERPKAPVLIVCPTSVIGNWLREAQRFAPELPVHVHHGADRIRGGRFARVVKGQALVLTSYALLHRDADMFADVDWRGVVLDEAQNVKNPESKQARAARALGAGYRIALTGTPVENHVGDLWAIMEFLNAGLLGTQAAFKRDFLIPIQALRDADATERLKRLTAPFVLRRLKSDASIIADLPEKNEMNVFCTLTREQGSLYQAVLRDLEDEAAEADGIERRGKILALLSKLKQVCNHPAQFAKDRSPVAGRSGKLSRLEEMLEEVLAIGERALIFTQFAEMGELLTGRLSERFGREVLFLHGGVPKRQRDEMLERFQGERGPAIFVLSLKAGGSGLNLTAANHVFHFDRWWNPAVENQATDRAFRIGQKKNVQVHKFVCAGTLEERIADLIDRKRAIAEHVIGSGEAWLTELPGKQLRELVALSAEAVEE